MNSVEIPITDPRIVILFVSVVMLFVGAKMAPEKIGDSLRAARRQVIGHVMAVIGLLVLLVMSAVLLVQDGTTAALVFLPILAVCGAFFVVGFLWKPLNDTLEAVRLLRSAHAGQ